VTLSEHDKIALCEELAKDKREALKSCVMHKLRLRRLNNRKKK